MNNRIVRTVVYIVFFFVCLVFFTAQGFPIGLLQSRIEREVQHRTGMKMTTGQMSFLFPNGIEAKTVRLMKESDQADKPDLVILMPKASARMSVFSLFSSSKDLSFSGQLLTGKIEGELYVAKESMKLKASLHSIDLGRLPIWKELMGLSLAGKLSGKADLSLAPKDIKTTKGTMGISLVQGSLGEGTIKGLSTPSISLGKTQATMEMDKGKINIKSFSVRSDDIEASIEGYFLLQKKIDQLSARCKIRFKPSADFLGRNPKFKDIINLSGMNRAKDKDGFFSYSMYGRLTHPQFRAAK